METPEAPKKLSQSSDAFLKFAADAARVRGLGEVADHLSRDPDAFRRLAALGEAFDDLPETDQKNSYEVGQKVLYPPEPESTERVPWIVCRAEKAHYWLNRPDAEEGRPNHLFCSEDEMLRYNKPGHAERPEVWGLPKAEEKTKQPVEPSDRVDRSGSRSLTAPRQSADAATDDGDRTHEHDGTESIDVEANGTRSAREETGRDDRAGDRPDDIAERVLEGEIIMPGDEDPRVTRRLEEDTPPEIARRWQETPKEARRAAVSDEMLLAADPAELVQMKSTPLEDAHFEVLGDHRGGIDEHLARMDAPAIEGRGSEAPTIDQSSATSQIGSGGRPALPKS